MNFTKTALFLVIFAAILLPAGLAIADTISSNAHIRLTDGSFASSSPSDTAWVAFNKDSTQLPTPLPSAPNTSLDFFGTGEFRNQSNIPVELSIESLLDQAGSGEYRANIYWQLFAEPSQTSPYWDWTWYDNHPDGQRIMRAENSGQTLNLLVNKVPRWANKSLPIEHPPMQSVIEEQVTLNGTAPSSLSHKFVLGEKNEGYDKANVVLVGQSTANVANETAGVGNGTAWQEFTLQHASVVPGSERVYVNGALWSEADFFRGSSTLDKKAFVFFPNTGKIRFGDGWNGSILPSGATVTVSYSYYTNPYREYSGSTYNTTDQLDYRIDYTNGTIRRTTNSTIPDGATVKITYFYLDTAWWQRFWTELVNHYKGKVKYYEVWNEENLSQSFPGTVDQYAELLRTAYTSIKGTDSTAVVLLGGLGYDSTFLPQLYSKGTKNYFDVLAWHPYGWQLGPDNPNSAFNTLNNSMIAAANANGDSSKQIFFNEIGYSTNQQGGLSWADQGTALSRTLMKVRRMPNVINVSWWGPVDDAPIGQQESDLYYYHLGLMAYDSSNNLIQKPAYYVFKNIANNKGLIIDLASYDSSGNLVQGQFDVNTILFSSYGDDVSSVTVSYSLSNTTDWQQVSSNMVVQGNSRNTFTYTVKFQTVHARYIQIQFVKKTNASDFAVDEVQVFSTTGTNVALNKYYSVEGFEPTYSGNSTNLCGNGKADSGETHQNCPSDVQASDPVCTGSQVLCGGQCITPLCALDSDCNDNNSLTIDTCLNPASCSASCQNAPIQCGIGQIICGAQCTTPICSTSIDCNDNNSLTTDTCVNAGTCSATCQHTAVTPSCSPNQALCNGQCTAVACASDSDCSDNNPSTTDTCTNAGTCNASCQNTPITATTTSTGGNTSGGTGGTTPSPPIACLNDKACNDNNPCTTDTCTNPGKTNSKCVFTKMKKCRALFVNLMFVNVMGGVTKGIEFTASITDDNGLAMADANVTYNNQLKVTDQSGKVSFTAASSDLPMTAAKEGYDQASTIVHITAEGPGLPNRSLSLVVPNAVVAGEEFLVIVTDENGSPIKGANVVYGNQQKITDEKGTAKLIADSNAEIVFASDGLAQQKAVLSIQGQSIIGTLTDIDIIFVVAVAILVILIAYPFLRGNY